MCHTIIPLYHTKTEKQVQMQHSLVNQALISNNFQNETSLECISIIFLLWNLADFW